MQNTTKYLQIFIADSRKELTEMNGLLQNLETNRDNAGLINDLFRKAHSLKGMAATMGFTHLSEVSHAIEEPLNEIREGKAKLTRGTVDLLYEGVGFLEELVNEAIGGAPARSDYKSFIGRLKGQVDGEKPVLPEEQSNISYEPPKLIPVDTKTLDDLINIVGEMILHRGRLMELSRPLSSHELEEEIQFLGSLVRDLYDQVIKLRMMPIASATDFLHRMARALAQGQQKEIDFCVEGEKGIKLDRTILGELMDPLIHLIRNAVDHGIELPSLIKEKGKAPGRIWLRFSREREMVRVEVEDNGRGIHVPKIKDQARKKRIISEKEVACLSDEDTLMLLCRPGFTTSQQVTEISGRGVGLDVVRDRVEKLGGSIQISSIPDTGTKVTLHIPSTTQIIFALLVKVNIHIFALPASSVLATTTLNLNGLQGCLIFHDENIPLVLMKDLLRIEEHSGGAETSSPIIVVEVGGKRVGMIVDEILTMEQIFVKPLGKPLDRIEGLFGATILGDGKVALVLDLERLR
jgi:two-component system chemotaxis sensor kinase CheA